MSSFPRWAIDGSMSLLRSWMIEVARHYEYATPTELKARLLRSN
jgi:hypothetical protein